MRNSNVYCNLCVKLIIDLKPNSITVRYLVADRSEAVRRPPAASWNLAYYVAC